jgi:hypothetical protein
MKVCPHCGEEVEPRIIDDGIGRTEAWGIQSVHHEWLAVCPVCEETMEWLGNGPKPRETKR